MGKATQAQSRERQEIIYAMMLDGYSTYAIVRFAREKWDIKRSAVERYITKINKNLAETKQESFEAIRQKAIQRCERFREKCRKAKDLRTEATIIKEINEIEGVKIKKHELTGADGTPFVPAQVVITLPDNGRSKN